MATSIRILFYTDYDDMTDQSCSEFGLSELKKLILFKTAPLCGIFTLQIRSINRHRDLVTGQIVKGANKLTRELLDQFDEIWFFGYLQTNTLETAENELGNNEVSNLRAWMDAGGGVFVTGDHANPDPRLALDDPRNKDHQTYLGLGRALGHRIPRAGRLRAWEGPPTSDVSSTDLERRDNYNTLVGNLKDLDDASFLQTDAIAQELILVGKIPHRLFWLFFNPDKSITPVTKFPDHMHEGQLLIPDPLDGDWPTTERKPTIVARGRDNRPFKEKRTYPLVIAYDGHVVPGSSSGITLGRIVADSSFHHYVNTNLIGFERDACGNPPAASDLDQIAQYFANLALWLAPQQVHDQIKQGLIHLLGNHPQILEVRGNNIFSLGRTALAILSNFGDLILNQLFNLSDHPQPRVIEILLSLLFLGRSGSIEINERERTDALGLVVRLLHQRFSFEDLIERKSTLDGLTTLSSLETDLKHAFQESSISEFLTNGEEGVDALLKAGLESAK
jgi:hypothetical protein